MTTEMAGTSRTRTDVLVDLEHEMGRAVRRVRRALSERARALDPDLQIPGLLVLSELGARGPVRSAALVEALGLDKGAVSRHVQHLVDLGLVGREPDPRDGRAALLRVTPEAIRRLAAVAERRRTDLDARLSDWTAAELDAFVGMLGRYNRSLA